MGIYVNGKKITDIYVEGRGIKFGYANGKLVFSKQSGWQAGASCTLTVSSAYNNSVAGSVILNRYDYYEGGLITDSYYEVASTTLSRAEEGVVDLDLGSDAVVLFGDRASNAEYSVPANGTIRLSASEFTHIYRLKKTTGTLELGRSKTVTSYYVEPIYNMQIYKASDIQLGVMPGWTIANNRTSRLSLKSNMVVDISSLVIPKEGTWPVYAVGESATEGTVSTLTCITTAHQVYKNSLMKCLGWITVSGGKITNVTNLALVTGAEGTKATSGSTLTVTNGYWTDTGGYKVYVPDFTYDFSDTITAAQDTTSTEEVAHVQDKQTGSYAVVFNPETSLSIEGPATVKLYGSIGWSWPGKKSVSSLMYQSSTTGTAWQSKNFTNKSSATWDGINLSAGQTMTKARMTGSVTDAPSASHTGTGHLYVYSTVAVQGTPQTRSIYVKVTRNTNNSNKATEVQTATGTSSPFVSYVYIGSLTVQRNASTGSIT